MKATISGLDPVLFLQSAPSLWLEVFTIDLTRYLFGAGLVSLVLYWWLRDFSAMHRIQSRRPSRTDYCREIRHSIATVSVYASIALVTLALIDSGKSKMYAQLQEYPTWYLPVSIVMLLVLQDAYFYWVHRLMHHPKLFKYFHRVHHLSLTPTPWAAYSFAVPEAALMACFVPLAIQILPVHSVALFIFLLIMILRNAMGHSGIEFHPQGWVDSPLDVLTTVTHHDLHHQKFTGNFGLYFTWWDRWMGTELPEYKEVFRQASSKQPAISAKPIDSRKGHI